MEAFEAYAFERVSEGESIIGLYAQRRYQAGLPETHRKGLLTALWAKNPVSQERDSIE